MLNSCIRVFRISPSVSRARRRLKETDNSQKKNARYGLKICKEHDMISLYIKRRFPISSSEDKCRIFCMTNMSNCSESVFTVDDLTSLHAVAVYVPAVIRCVGTFPTLAPLPKFSCMLQCLIGKMTHGDRYPIC